MQSLAEDKKSFVQEEVQRCSIILGRHSNDLSPPVINTHVTLAAICQQHSGNASGPTSKHFFHFTSFSLPLNPTHGLASVGSCNLT